MNSPLSLEQRLRAFYAQQAAVRAPDRVLENAMRLIESTPQRRRIQVPWRYSTMPVTLRLTFGAALLALALIGSGLVLVPRTSNQGGVGGSPTATASAVPSVSASPSASPTVAGTPIDTTGWLPFTSARHGYSLRYPADWTARHA